MKILFRHVALSSLSLLLGVQLVPYGRDHTNPPILCEPAWDARETRDLAATACFDCHSNETNWPWYSHVAPFSWLVQRDVDLGRSKLNFSEWHALPEDAIESMPSLCGDDMPPAPYRRAHPLARLTPRERHTLSTGLERTLTGAAQLQADGQEPALLPKDEAVPPRADRGGGL